MLNWITANLSTIVISAILLAIVSSFDPAEETGKVLLRLQLRTLRHAWPVPR